MAGQADRLDEMAMSNKPIYGGWQYTAKINLLKAIEECGFSVIHDMSKLKQYIPDRNENEIRHLISSLKRKGREWIKGSNDGGQTVREKPEIEAWLSVLNDSVSATDRTDDMSALFADIFKEFSDEPNEKENNDAIGDSPNLKELYGYLSDSLAGKYPRKLNSAEGIVILSLMNKLTNLMNSDVKNDALLFNRTRNWHPSNGIFAQPMLIPSENETVVPTPDIAETQLALTYSHDFSQASSSSSSQSVATVDHNLNDFNKLNSQNGVNSSSGDPDIDEYIGLPMIKKIHVCLNPLNVPISLLQKTHEKVDTFLKQNLDDVLSIASS